jgi:hypothetical protein
MRKKTKRICRKILVTSGTFHQTRVDIVNSKILQNTEEKNKKEEKKKSKAPCESREVEKVA